MALFDRIHSHHIARVREGFGRLYARTPTAGEVKDELIEVGEVVGVTALAGAAEAYYGEDATTVMMTAQKDAAGNELKDAKGNTLTVSGTGLPYTALGAAGLLIAVNFGVIASPALRKHATNVAVGLGAAVAYRKAFGWGQKQRDAADKAAGKPPTYGVNAFGGPIKIEGDKRIGQGSGPSAEVVSILEESRAEIRRQRAAGQR